MGDVTTIVNRPGVTLTCPSPIQTSHDFVNFDCGKPPLTDWLKTLAMKQEGRSARTYVVCSGSAGLTVVGYYAIATGGIERSRAIRPLRRNMPDPLPVMVLGRLAVDKEFQNHGIGGGLLRDALRRTVQAAAMVGVAALIVHALDDDALAFYIKYGFVAFPQGSRTLFMPVQTIEAAL